MTMNTVSHVKQKKQPKHSRVSAPKTRTGCITCKRRHIKCDEAKPHCSNCLKARRHCEGYPEPRSAADAPGFVQFCWDSRPTTTITRRARPRLLLSPPLNTESLAFRDGVAALYFQEFVALVRGPWITAASNGDLWGVTLPQLARNNDTLRQAAIAIGALGVWHSKSKHESLRAVSVPTRLVAERDSHYFHAVSYYCHSLKLQSQKSSVQDAVFLSILLLFFESLRGNKKAALSHVNHALAMLLALLTDADADRHKAELGPNPEPLLASVADIYTHLASQARTVLHGRIGHGPPLPSLAKGLKSRKQTMESFIVLLSQLPRSTVAIDRIPSVFNSLDEYEEYWLAVQRAQTAMTPIMVETMRASGVFGSQDANRLDAFYADILDNPRIQKFCGDTRKAMHALDAAFLPLFNKIITTTDSASPARLRAIHLRLQFLGVYIFDDTPSYRSPAAMSSRTPLFQSYLSLAAAALHTARHEVAGKRNPALSLALQCGLSWRLLVVALFCRDARTRDEAVRMLGEYPGQDGLWDTRALYVLARRNREVVERGEGEGTREEQWGRLLRREFVFEEGGERVVLRYLDRDGDGGWRLVEEVAEMGGGGEGEGEGEVKWTRRPLTGSGGPLVVDLYAAQDG
ncbi:uncharacterized protein GGS25DRAFT_527696 [Hypoxylon fragiforme]|uniref:uncharacterized protein n=1 Tax=Hypoxylon fragiforme TaxID=63214 RepID=UPI0020C6154D|nr:uncharacterized protein GGS25DRAFT_527696 [Hypoxylon fragiforme]KAI2614677.1 hypothetical protein GGS25DRAFT_527696 [Hypoxylon fragiforme]